MGKTFLKWVKYELKSIPEAEREFEILTDNELVFEIQPLDRSTPPRQITVHAAKGDVSAVSPGPPLLNHSTKFFVSPAA